LAVKKISFFMKLSISGGYPSFVAKVKNHVGIAFCVKMCR